MRACVYHSRALALCVVVVVIVFDGERIAILDNRTIHISHANVFTRIWCAISNPLRAANGGKETESAQMRAISKWIDTASIDIEIEPEIRTSIRETRDRAIPMGES